MTTAAPHPAIPTWKATLDHYASLAVADLVDLREIRAKRLAEYARDFGIMGLNLGLAEFYGLRPLIACGPDLLRDELRPLVPYARAEAEQMFRDYYRPGRSIGTAALRSATGVCVYECLGLDADSALSVFKPELVRVETSRQDENVFHHWNRALTAIALDDRRTWGPICGLLPNHAVPFTPGQMFEFNVQGFITHLAGALVHGGSRVDVTPAWDDLLRCYPYLEEVNMTDGGTLLWAARVVHHHIGGEPLGTVGAFLYSEIRKAVSAEQPTR